MMNWIRLTAMISVLALSSPALAETIKATLYKTPQCGCCENYAAYLRKNGFEIDIRQTDDLAGISRKAGVPEGFQGCHTMFVNGYVVDGHVPVATLNKLLSERPAIAGIALPGMPLGSPGMGGSKEGPFTIYAVTKDGAPPAVYATE
ncbi:MAG: DUF411 domain-containing protein [Parvibaculaceae bacterium]